MAARNISRFKLLFQHVFSNYTRTIVTDKKSTGYNVDDITIKYITNIDDADKACEEIRQHYNEQPLGFDVEWKPTKVVGVDLIQICPGALVYNFHVAAMNGFPKNLQNLLMEGSRIKAGVNIKHDFKRIKDAYHFEVNEGVVDLSDLAVQKGFVKINGTWGLKALANTTLGWEMKMKRKGRYSLQQSDWDKIPLTDEQLKYSSLDTYAAYLIFQKLQSMRDSRPGEDTFWT